MNDTPAIGGLLRQLTERLAAVSDSPRLDAELLIGRAIDMPRAYLIAHADDVPDAAALERLEANVERRLAGEPMAYITGSKEFWSMELVVSPATLVPRPETELVVEHALRLMPRRSDWRVLDLGTGSGAIALAIARERPHADVTGVDVSADAIAVAEINARELKVANVRFTIGDWTTPVAGQIFDLIVANPPYVRDDDEALDRLAREPRAALAAGRDGLDALRVLARDCRRIIANDGTLVLEHGAAQERAVAELLVAHGWRDVACHRDYAGLPRVSTARAATICDT